MADREILDEEAEILTSQKWIRRKKKRKEQRQGQKRDRIGSSENPCLKMIGEGETIAMKELLLKRKGK